jgi:4-amino-4-deoxy-L-arabinose transferase-like glycosyltransferase
MFRHQSIPTKIYQEGYSIKLGDRSFTLSYRMILIAILMVAVTLRLFSAFYQGNDISDLPGVYDQISYDGLARRVVDGYGFSFAEDHWPATRAGEPTAHWSYLYTLYLAAIYKVFGTYPLIARVIQALIGGVFQTFLVWRIGTHLFNRSVGLIAAALNAVYIYFFYYAGALITETFYITCILWTFDASFRLVRDNAKMVRWHQWIELGLAIGLTVLLRQVFLLFLPFLFLWIWWNVRDEQANESGWKNYFKHRIHWSAIKGLSVVVLILALMIAPWTIRNYRVFGTFVLLNTNAGFAFYWGNHPIHGTQFIPLLPSGARQYLDLIPTELLSLNEAELDKTLLKLGIQFVLDDLGRFLLLSITRMEEYFKFWPSSDSGLISNISRVGSFGISLPFIIYGLWLEIYRIWSRQTLVIRWSIILVLCFVVIYTLIHLFSWTLIRYRLPVDSVLIIFAALGIDSLLKKIFLPR